MSFANFQARESAKHRLLLRALNRFGEVHTVLAIKLHRHLRIPNALVVETASFDAGGVGHDFELGVEGGAAVPAKPMIVHLPRVPLDIIALRAALGDLEGLTGDDHVRGVCAAGPFLAVQAVTERGGHGLARELVVDGATHATSGGHGGEGRGNWVLGSKCLGGKTGKRMVR